MKVLTNIQAEQWCKTRSVDLDANHRPLRPGSSSTSMRFELPQTVSRLVWLCRLVAAKLKPWPQCLMWITSWGIWESSENLHLYYRMRQSYGDLGLLEDAAAHLFLDYEGDDLISFLQIGITSGWDIHLLTGVDKRAFVSHDGWLEFALSDAGDLEELRREFGTDQA